MIDSERWRGGTEIRELDVLASKRCYLAGDFALTGLQKQSVSISDLQQTTNPERDSTGMFLRNGATQEMRDLGQGH